MIIYKNLVYLVLILAIASITFSCSDNSPSKRSKQKSKYLKVNNIVRGAVSAANLQLYIIEYSQENGVMPKDNAALKLGMPASLARDALKSIEIKNGHIILTYNEKSGIDNGQIVFSPTIDFETRWVCNTDAFKGIEEFLPQCTYQVPPLNIEKLTKGEQE